MQKSKKTSKKYLPYLFIFLALIAIVAVGIFFAKNNNNNSTNINDSAVDWSTFDEKIINLSSSGSQKLTSPGVYTLTGTLEDGMIEVSTSGTVKLILDNVTIKNSNGPAILVSESELVVIETKENSTNYLSDSAKYSVSDEDICATLFSKDDLVLEGSGKLFITGNYEDGIVSKDDLKINSGSYELDTKDEGIRGRDSVEILGGEFIINSGGDAIKSNNSEEIGKGTVSISDGTFSISAGDDGIHAETNLEINGGTIDIEKSYEGLEGANISINGGDIKINASDDGINAAGGNDGSSPNMRNYNSSSSNYSIVIGGGNIYVNSLGDGIDSNGSLVINGGEVVVDGPANSANGALDSETGIVYNGGTVIALGASGMATAPDESSNGYSISAFFDTTYSAGTKISVKDASGNLILSHVSSKTFSHASLSSEQFKEGQTYIIYINEAEVSSITLTGKTTRIGSGAQMMGPGGAPAQKEGNQRFEGKNP